MPFGTASTSGATNFCLGRQLTRFFEFISLCVLFLCVASCAVLYSTSLLGAPMRLTNRHGVVCHTFVTCLSFCFNTHAPTPPDVRERQKKDEHERQKEKHGLLKKGRIALPASEGKTV